MPVARDAVSPAELAFPPESSQHGLGGCSVPFGMPFDYGLPFGACHPVLVQDLLEIMDLLFSIPQGQTFFVMFAFRVEAFFHDLHRRVVLQQRPYQIEIIWPGESNRFVYTANLQQFRFAEQEKMSEVTRFRLQRRQCLIVRVDRSSFRYYGRTISRIESVPGGDDIGRVSQTFLDSRFIEPCYFIRGSPLHQKEAVR